jgi:hypothetical protein
MCLPNARKALAQKQGHSHAQDQDIEIESAAAPKCLGVCAAEEAATDTAAGNESAPALPHGAGPSKRAASHRQLPSQGRGPGKQGLTGTWEVGTAAVSQGRGRA